MTGWLLGGIFALGYVVTWPHIARWFAYVEFDHDLYAGLCFGSFFTLFWPVLLPGIALRRLSLRWKGSPEAVLALVIRPPRGVREKELASRIAALEREVGISG